jgi:hypothetical protein
MWVRIDQWVKKEECNRIDQGVRIDQWNKREQWVGLSYPTDLF